MLIALPFLILLSVKQPDYPLAAINPTASSWGSVPETDAGRIKSRLKEKDNAN
jgi:hypothetical protein